LLTDTFYESGTTNAYVGFVLVAVPSGTSGDIVTTFNNTMTALSVGTYHLRSIAGLTPADTDSINGNASPTLSVDVPDGGIVAAVAVSATGSGCSISSGVLSDEIGGGNFNENFRFLIGHHDFVRAQTVDIGMSLVTTGSAAFAASWGPATILSGGGGIVTGGKGMLLTGVG
jgi:hypothetical protein